MSQISLKNVSKSFGGHEVIKSVDLEIKSGEFCVFVGPSGCGKSTLLRMIAGLEDVTDGQICLDDDVVNDFAPADRGLAMVFQSYALYPHMSVEQNMSFGLRRTGHSKRETAKRVQDAAEILQLAPLMKRKPAQLSGGQRQRVAIGRAIVRNPRAFLFDEPLSNLDAELRTQMRVELAQLHQRLGSTMIYVTHDQVEAMTLADRIVVLRDGKVEQSGTPDEIYSNPKNQFVAGFIGSPRMNLLTLEGPLNAIEKPEGAKVLGVRPEALTMQSEALSLKATVRMSENLGGTSILHTELEDGQTLIVEARGENRPKPDEILHLGAPQNHQYWFDNNGQRIMAEAH